MVGSELSGLLAGSTDGRGLDIFNDPVGGALRELAFQHLAPFGRHIVLGNASGDDRPFSGDAVWLDSKQVIGLSLGGIAHLIPDRVSAALESIFLCVERGTLHLAGAAIRPLEEVPAAHRALESRSALTKTELSGASRLASDCASTHKARSARRWKGATVPSRGFVWGRMYCAASQPRRDLAGTDRVRTEARCAELSRPST
jgi:hypothetical protein